MMILDCIPGIYPQIVSRRFRKKSPPIPKRAATATSFTHSFRHRSRTYRRGEELTERREECPEDEEEDGVPMVPFGLEVELAALDDHCAPLTLMRWRWYR